VIQGTDAQLARAALHLFLQVDRPGVVGLCPGNVRRPKQGDYRHVKSRGKMARPTIGCDEQVAAANASFSKAHGQRMARQRLNSGTVGQPDDLLRQLPFAGAAQHENATAALVDQVSRQAGKVPGGPVLGGSESRPRIEANDLSSRSKTGLLPDG